MLPLSCLLWCFLRNSWLLTRVGKKKNSLPRMTLIPVISGCKRGRGGVRLGIKDGLVVGGKFRRRNRVGVGQDSTSLHGFHVEEIHLLELIKI